MLHEHQSGTAAEEPRTVSRRRLIVTGAGLAAAGVAVGAAASIPFSTNGTAAEVAGAEKNPDQPVMVHLRDAVTGKFDVFVGTRRFQLDDRAFAARLAHAVTAG